MLCHLDSLDAQLAALEQLAARRPPSGRTVRACAAKWYVALGLEPGPVESQRPVSPSPSKR